MGRWRALQMNREKKSGKKQKKMRHLLRCWSVAENYLFLNGKLIIIVSICSRRRWRSKDEEAIVYIRTVLKTSLVSPCITILLEFSFQDYSIKDFYSEKGLLIIAQRVKNHFSKTYFTVNKNHLFYSLIMPQRCMPGCLFEQ